MFSQIVSLQGFGSYYHLWAGFDDGAFIGYYDKGAVSFFNVFMPIGHLNVLYILPLSITRRSLPSLL